jgi:nicotinamide-nucleotide amidase
MKELKQLMLREPKLTVAAAESLTCGRVQAILGSVSGSSDYFLGGITAYSLAQKVRHLGVDRTVAKPVNSVSAEVAEQMALGACRLFGSELGVATTGYAEPSKADAVSTPYAWWAVAHRSAGKVVALRSGRVECPGANRIEAQTIVAEAVVAELVDYLQQLRSSRRRR